MPNATFNVTGDPYSFQQAFAERFADPVSDICDVLFERAVHEAANGYPLSARETVLQAVSFARWSSPDCRPYLCGLAARLLLDAGQPQAARKLCLEGIDSAEDDLQSDLHRLLDLIDSEGWRGLPE